MFTAMSASDGRIFGLDVMRATAILLVVFWHSYDLITELAPGFEAPFFLDGVDLFFVLSGYLIGGILLAHLRKEDVPWGVRLKDFWLRRFFRTPAEFFFPPKRPESTLSTLPPPPTSAIPPPPPSSTDTIGL